MKQWSLAVAIVTSCTLAVPAVGDERVSAGVHSFSDNSDNSVDTYVVDFLKSMQNWTVALRGAFDRVQLPPLPGLPGSPENIDAITGASRPVPSVSRSKDDYTKTRNEVVGSVQWRPLAEISLGGSYYHSVESDWLGRQVGVDVAQDFSNGNTNLALSVAYGFDRITPDEHTNASIREESRTTQDFTFVWTQTLSPRTLGQIGVENALVQGFQSNPYRQVYAGGDRHPERHPDERSRHAVFGQIDHYLMTRAAASFLARYYNDDWGVRAGTFDLRLTQYVSDHLTVRYRYRYHTQTAAAFYSEDYASENGIDGYLTADYKLNDLDSNLFGIKVSVPFENLSVSPALSGLVLEAKYERYFDSQSFAANIFETGFTWPF